MEQEIALGSCTIREYKLDCGRLCKDGAYIGFLAPSAFLLEFFPRDIHGDYGCRLLDFGLVVVVAGQVLFVFRSELDAEI